MRYPVHGVEVSLEYPVMSMDQVIGRFFSRRRAKNAKLIVIKYLGNLTIGTPWKHTFGDVLCRRFARTCNS